MPPSAIVLCVLALLTCVLSYAVIDGDHRYVPLGADPANTPASSETPWQASAWGVESIRRDGRDNFEVRLRADAAGRVPFLRKVIQIPHGADGIRIRAAVRAEGIVAGLQQWQDGRLQIATYTRSEGLLTHWPGRIAQVSSTRAWHPYGRVIPAPPEPAIMIAVIYNGASAGTLYVRDIEIEAVKERPLYRVLFWVLIGAWGCIAIATAWLLLRLTPSIPRLLPLFGVVVVALASVLTPQPFFMKVTGPLDEQLEVWMDQLAPPPPAPSPPALAGPLAPPDDISGPGDNADTAPTSAPSPPDQTRADRAPQSGPEETQRPAAPPPSPSDTAAERPLQPVTTLVQVARELGIRRDDVNIKTAGHAAVFFAIALASFLAFPQVAVGWRIAFLFLFAVSTEALQLFVITRTSSGVDLIIDAVGLGTGCVVGWALARLLTASHARAVSAASAERL